MGCELPTSLATWANYCDCWEAKHSLSNNQNKNNLSNQIQCEKQMESKPSMMEQKSSKMNYNDKKRMSKNIKHKILHELNKNELVILKKEPMNEQQISDFSQPNLGKTAQSIGIIPLEDDPQIQANNTRIYNPIFQQNLKIRNNNSSYVRTLGRSMNIDLSKYHKSKNEKEQDVFEEKKIEFST